MAAELWFDYENQHKITPFFKQKFALQSFQLKQVHFLARGRKGAEEAPVLGDLLFLSLPPPLASHESPAPLIFYTPLTSTGLY